MEYKGVNEYSWVVMNIHTNIHEYSNEYSWVFMRLEISETLENIYSTYFYLNSKELFSSI